MKATRFLVVAWLLTASGMAQAIGLETRRVTPPNRPYIVEIGEPRRLDATALERERRVNSELRTYMDTYGWPDYAEAQEIDPNPPWAAYEVRLYYLSRDREIAFGRAFIAPSVTDLGLVKYQGRIDAGTRDRIVALVAPPRMAAEEPEPVEMRRVVAQAPAPPSDFEMLVQRIEAAADRAAVAGDRAVAASEAASHAADRAANVIEKMIQ